MRKAALIVPIIFSAGLALAVPGFSPAQAPASIAAQLDQLLSSVFKPDQPGAALLIMKDGQVLVRKAYGLADLELGVPLEPDMVFEIGSMTKQFTAVSILMLMERGQLSLSDPITKFLPDYPTRGKTITVEHLLTHTSGIQSYTDMAAWRPLMRKDMGLTELIGIFKDQPMLFAPGERWRYNNSGYILLGAIIEKISGLTYEAFLQKNVFDPLGLKHTFYGSASRIIPRRASGYGPGAGGAFLNAEFISMTQPYAAGSLLSSVDDLSAWNTALLAGKLIKRETLERAWTPSKLADGTSTNYGYGWGVSEYEGHRMIQHGGGIPGFTSDGILFPEDKLCVIMLTNSAVPGRAPGPFAFKAAALALAKPYREPKAVDVPAAELAPLAGTYANKWNERFTVRVTGTTVTISAPGISPTAVFPLSRDLFFPKDARTRVEFTRDSRGRPVEVRMTGGFGPEAKYIRTDK